jgi:hypothetical protein
MGRLARWPSEGSRGRLLPSRRTPSPFSGDYETRWKCTPSRPLSGVVSVQTICIVARYASTPALSSPSFHPRWLAHKKRWQTVTEHSSSGATCRARPLPGDLLDWHFVLLGGNGTNFEGGMYHGRIMLDNEYPMKPPRIFFYTESGRFETGVAICAIPLHAHAPHRRCDPSPLAMLRWLEIASARLPTHSDSGAHGFRHSQEPPLAAHTPGTRRPFDDIAPRRDVAAHVGCEDSHHRSAGLHGDVLR